MTGAYTIDCVGWHTRTEGNPESREEIVARFLALARFLQENGLVVRSLPQRADDITDSFSIRSDDLTPLGLAVLKRSYDRWVGQVAGSAAPDAKVLEKSLRAIMRAGEVTPPVPTPAEPRAAADGEVGRAEGAPSRRRS